VLELRRNAEMTSWGMRQDLEVDMLVGRWILMTFGRRDSGGRDGK